MSSSKVSLKLLIDTKAHKVLFAEAGKDFVDFLFNLLSLPVGTVVRLLTKTSMIGSLGNLYESVENLNETYMQSNQSKETLLKPQAPSSSAQVALLLTDEVSTVKKVYKCGNCHQYIADDPRAICPYCRYTMSTQVTWVKPKVANNASSSEGGGYVKGVVTYMIKDDLVVTPMSTISGITMLNKCNITNISALEEKVVTFGMGEGLKLLKAALQSKEVLTSIFLGEKVAEVAKPRSQPGRNKRFATAQSQPGRNKRFATAQ